MNYKEIECIVREAGALMLKSVQDNQIYTKGRADFVTDSDIAVQRHICERLREMYPDIGFICEESNDYGMGDSGMQWILDPIDGTTNYIYGYKMSAISLALKKDSEIVFGIVYNPFTDELFSAVKGKGTCLNGEPIRVSDKQYLKESLIAVGTSPYHKELATEVFERIRIIFENSLDVRRTGSAAIDMAYVACGRQDGYFEYNLKAWDYAAGYLLVEEAGGVVKTMAGTEMVHGSNSDILVCCSENLMKEMLVYL